MPNIFIYIVLALYSFVNILVPISGTATVTPILVLLTDPHRAVGLAAFFFMLTALFRIFIFRKEIQFEYVKKLILPSLISAVIGAFALVTIPPRLLLIIILGFSIYFLYKAVREHLLKHKIEKVSNFTATIVGVLSGFLQGSGLAGSDLRNNYLYSKGLSIVQVHGTTAIIGFSNFLLATIVRLYKNQITIPDLMPLIYVAPFMIIGILVGRKFLLKLKKVHTDLLVIFVMAMIIIFLLKRILFG